MLSKNELKYYASLLVKKYRDKENKFLCEGKNLVLEGILSNFKCDIIITTHEFADENREFLKQAFHKNIRTEQISAKDFERISETKTPQGISAVFNKKENHKSKGSIILALEDISDPGNLGTLIRTADWFGIDTVLLGETCAEMYNPKVLRSTMGSFFHVNCIESGNLIKQLKQLQSGGFRILTADMHGKSIYKFGTPEKIAVVVCSEAHGPSEELLKICDEIITIPKQGKAESLNAASAGAVILSELTKKRGA